MRPKNSQVSIIVPTYNEKENIVALIEELRKNISAPLEIIVVDDGSPDGTGERVEELSHPEVKVIHRKTRGLAGAFHRGILEATGDLIGWMDADMTMPAHVMKKLISYLDEFDIAIGSRYVKGGLDNRHTIRVLASKAINGLARFILGGSIMDYDSGFIAIRREVFDYITIVPIGYGDYFIEFIYDACRAGLKIKEVGYEFRDRTKGVSKSAPSLVRFLVTGLRYVIRIFSLRLRFLTGRD